MTEYIYKFENYEINKSKKVLITMLNYSCDIKYFNKKSNISENCARSNNEYSKYKNDHELFTLNFTIFLHLFFILVSSWLPEYKFSFIEYNSPPQNF